MVRKQRWVILLVLVALSGGMLWLLWGRASIEEGRCRLRLKANPDRDPITFLVTQSLDPLSSRPSDIKDVPPDIRRPSYYYFAAGGKQIPLAVDFSGDLKMCLDADGDGRLSGERCHPARLIKSLEERVTFRNKFGPLSLTIGQGETRAITRFSILSYRHDKPGPLLVYPSHYRSGRLRLGEKTCMVAVIDGDYDGRYKTKLSLPLDRPLQPHCDVFAIDLNGDGRFEASDTAGEILPLTEMVVVEGKYYILQVADDGGMLELIPAQPARGLLAVDPPNAALRLKLWSDAANQDLSPGTREWSLPAGRYRTVSGVLHLRDREEDSWTFSMLPRFGDLGSFEIQAGRTTRLRVGPPFVVKANVEKGYAGTVVINAVLLGCAGEEYKFDFGSNSRRVAEHSFKIVDEKGTVLVADKFQYG